MSASGAKRTLECESLTRSGRRPLRHSSRNTGKLPTCAVDVSRRRVTARSFSSARIRRSRFRPTILPSLDPRDLEWFGSTGNQQAIFLTQLGVATLDEALGISPPFAQPKDAPRRYIRGRALAPNRLNERLFRVYDAFDPLQQGG